jgi:ssDNA-binding Zn-finger/Zn-ribbon topoisomerase 1
MMPALRCPECGAPTRARRSRQGRHPFVACTRWPACRWTDGRVDPTTDSRLRAVRLRLLEIEEEIAALAAELEEVDEDERGAA